jgi:hypothetical protein
MHLKNRHGQTLRFLIIVIFLAWAPVSARAVG